MVPRKAKLVVDANIGSAATDRDYSDREAELMYPDPMKCRRILDTVLFETVHLAVMTPTLTNEWERNASYLGQRWRRMMTVRNRILEIDPPHSEKLWLEVSRVSGLERDDIEAMRKDLHLIEAALDQHAAVISSDEKARKPFHTVAQNVKKLTKIVWVNPEQNHEAVLSWLKAGAKPERQWRLGL